MIDRYLAYRDQRQGFDDVAGYTINQAIATRQFQPLEGSTTITAVYGPWHAMNSKHHENIRRRLEAAESGMLLYEFSPHILHPDPEMVGQSFRAIATETSTDIEQLRITEGIERVNALSFSLGNALMSMASQKTEFHNVAMVVPGSELAKPLWTGIRTQALRRMYASQGYCLKDLQELWHDLAPIRYVESLGRHTIRLIIAAHDKYIPTSSGLELHQALVDSGAHLHTSLEPGGHMLTAVRYLSGRII